MKEDALIGKILDGENSLFEQLMGPYQKTMLNIAYRMTGNAEDAKEICQEAIMNVFKYLKKFKKGSSFKNWAYKIVVNASYDFLHQRRKHQTIIASQQKNGVHEDILSPEEVYTGQELKTTLQKCLFVLTPKERSVYLLRDGEGLSIKETAEVLGYSSPSIRTHLSRARRKIRFQFEKIYHQGEGRRVS
jgi:RNA polymerase sigma-70 factor (ECF subfamily)